MTDTLAGRNHALLFANGPYQLLIGVACARRYFPRGCEIEVIPYDMKWQKELGKITCEFAKILKLKVIHIPLEFLKSSADNKKTYFVRSSLDHLLFFFYTKKYSKQYIFLPKMYGTPERSILLASSGRIVIIYDDGYGQYVNPKVHQSIFDKFAYRLIGLNDPLRNKIYISPRNPSLVNYDSSSEINIIEEGYSTELINVFDEIISDPETLLHFKNLKNNDSYSIMITLSRLSYTDVDKLIYGLSRLFTHFSQSFPVTKFLLKPHPRDVNLDFSALHNKINQTLNWCFLPKEIWCYPAEVICNAICPKVLLTGTSTVGINSDLIPQTKIMVFDFLSFNMPDYNEKSKEIMLKASNYFGNSVDDAITVLMDYLQNNLIQ